MYAQFLPTDVPEDSGIIDKIREIFTAASSTLFSATKGRAFFRQITILIPSTWKHKQEYEVGQSSSVKPKYEVGHRSQMATVPLLETMILLFGGKMHTTTYCCSACTKSKMPLPVFISEVW